MENAKKKSDWEIFFEFYNIQFGLLSNFEKKLYEELQQYEKWPKNKRRQFVFKLEVPVSLETLPLIMLKLKNKPSYSSRLSWYKTNEKIEALKEVENFLKSLEITPVRRTFALAKILFKWEMELFEKNNP